ncbi:ribbon-helix-helix domain-containing protein [Clostridium sporogenes]|uniref:ribbon-helix-helix domain-containing protein n=1 Tax=Clostridium sporogenes TaxID=1509 RepID=UPI0009BA3766|nr:ribbon-helix-helix domain-containing protein [Clostridium sporogenes]
METKKDTLVNRERYSSTFDKELLRKFKELSDETSIPASKLFDKALELLLKEYGKR